MLGSQTEYILDETTSGHIIKLFKQLVTKRLKERYTDKGEIRDFIKISREDTHG